MTTKLLSKPGIRLSFPFWPTALIGLVVVRAILLLAIKPGSYLSSYGAISYLILLVLATCLAIRNAIRSSLGRRAFWVFLAVAYSLWTLDQWIFLYYEYGPHTEVPNDSIADPVLFLHIVWLLAAVATLPSRIDSGHTMYRANLNALLLLFFWGFLYVYIVFPYQYFGSSASTYALRFDTLYLLENLALILATGILSLRVQAPWKVIYRHLLGASVLYALSSAVANVAIDSGGYSSGKLYGLGLTASVCWFVWIPLKAWDLDGHEARTVRFDANIELRLSAWVMLGVVLIFVPIAWEVFQRDKTADMRVFRLLVAAAAIVCLAGIAFIKEYLAKDELISQLGVVNNRLQLAMESGKGVGWELEIKTGRLSWFGDLETISGIRPDKFAGQSEDFYHYVHPEDRRLVANAFADARESGKPYQAEFRVIRRDGTVRWVASAGQFHYQTNGNPERMLGMAVDITERKQAEESLRLFRTLMDQSNDRIEVVDPETFRFLDVNDTCCRQLDYTRDELLNLTVFDVDSAIDEASVIRVQEQLDQSGFVSFESLHRRKDGSTYPVETSLKRVELERAYVIAVVRDMTERKRVEKTLTQKDEELKEAQRFARVGSWRWDARIDRVTWSEELYRILGRDSSLPVPNYKEHGSVYMPESWERLQRAVEESLRSGRPYELDLEAIIPGSTTKWVAACGEPLLDTDGQVIGLHGSVQDIHDRWQAEQARYESERKFRLILDSTAEPIYGTDLEGRCTFCNPACLRVLGHQRADDLLAQDMHVLLHQSPGEAGKVIPRAECRICSATRTGARVHADDGVLWRANGTSFPAEYWCYPQLIGQEVIGAVVAFFDITQRMLVEASLASVGGRLIQAQEQERSRIARELHDDIGQRLALLNIDLAKLQQSPGIPSELLSRIAELRKQATGIATGTQSLSHELHSSRMDYLDISAAIGGFCREFAAKHKVEIHFMTDDLRTALSRDISLCLFRVAQQAIDNAAKHSGVRRFEVRLWETSDEIHLTVADSGSGFDIEAAKTSPGLGLISMEERLRFVNGTLIIDSQPQAGTKIYARVPLKSEIEPKPADH